MMKKRVLSLILAVLMVLSVLPVMTLSVGAEEPEAATPATIDYFDLYVTDGLVGWYRIEDTYPDADGKSKKDINGTDIYSGDTVARDYLGNGVWVYANTYGTKNANNVPEGLLKGRIFYYGGFLDTAIDKEDAASNNNKIENDFTVETVLNSTASDGTTNGWFIQAGVYGLQSVYTGTMRRQVSSWNVKTTGANATYNTVNLNVYDDSSMYTGDNPWTASPNRMFSYTLRHDIEVSETPYKYDAEQNKYLNAAGDELPLALNWQKWPMNIMSEIMSGAFTKYLKTADENPDLADSYLDIKYFDEEAGIYKRLCARTDTYSALNTNLANAGVKGKDGLQAITKNNALAKEKVAISDDLPFDGYVIAEDYIDGVLYQFKKSDAPKTSTFPFVYGTYGDDFNEDGTNKQETLWNGQMFTSGTVTDGSERQFGTSNFFVGAANVRVDQIRLYDRLITDAEMYQNHFADIARLKTLDKEALALLVTLPEEVQAEVHLAFKDIQVSTTLTTDELNDKLYKAISAAYVTRYDAVSDEEIAFKNFATAEICTVENVYQLNLLTYIELPAFNKDLVNAKIKLDKQAVADAGEAQVYLNGLFAAYAFDYSGYEAIPEMFKEDLFDIYVEATSQEAIDKAEAVYAGIDFAEFNALNETLQAKVEEAMASDMAALKALAIAGDLAGAQAWLDTKVEAAVDTIYSDYDALYVQDGLYSHLSFLEVSKNELEGDDVAAWKNLIQGDVTNYNGANAILQRYVKYGDTNYKFTAFGTYFLTKSGDAVLSPTESDPTYIADRVIGSATYNGLANVQGNTFQFEEGYIVSPFHYGYYDDGTGAVAVFNSSSSLNVPMDKYTTNPKHQQKFNTSLTLPDTDSFFNKGGVTVQYVFSHGNTVGSTGTVSSSDRNGYRAKEFANLPFGVLNLQYYDAYTINTTWGFMFREYVGGAWKQKVEFSGTTGAGIKGDYDAPEEFGVANTYTFVSDLATTTVSSGDACVDGGNKYTAKTNLNFYVDDELALGADYFGKKQEDGLLWLGASAPNKHSIGYGGGMGLYAIRIYKKALSEDEILQNRFADIATFYHLDLRAYYDVDEADRIDAIKAFIDSLDQPDFSYETTGTGKTRKSAAVEALYEAAFAVEGEAQLLPLKYTEFYVTGGLMTHLNFLEVTEADNSEDFASVIMPDKNGGYTYSNLSTANAILDSYELVKDRKGTAAYQGTYALANDAYGKYFKTESGGYALIPTAEDPAVLDESGNLITYPGNTFMFGDGYIWSPYRNLGYYRTAEGTVAEIDPATMTVKNESGLPFGDTSARALNNQHYCMNYIFLPSVHYAPNLPKYSQSGTYQMVMAVDVGADGEATTVNSLRSDQTLRLPHIDISFNGEKGYTRVAYRYVNNTATPAWSVITPYDKGNIARNQAFTMTSRSEILDTNIPEDKVYTASNGEHYEYRSNYTFYLGIGNKYVTNEYFSKQPVQDGTRWLSSKTSSIWNQPEVGRGGGSKIYAIRVYNRAISDDEIIQNQFADVVGFYHLDARKMRLVSAADWDEFYPLFKDIKLDDATVDVAALQAQLDAKVDELTGYGAAQIVEFEGYQARNLDYNGLRALYTVNEEKLAEIEALGYEVEFGSILAIANGRAIEEIVGSVVDGDLAASVANAKSIKVYDGGEYTGKYFVNKTTGETQFACTLTYKGENAIKDNFISGVVLRPYVVVTKGGVSTVVYPDNSSDMFADGVSLQKVAKKYYDLGLGYNKLIQDALGKCGDLTINETPYTINGNNLADYTIVSAPDTMKFALTVREAIKTATGYTLPIADKAVTAGLAINIAHDGELADGTWSVDFDGNEAIIGGHGVAETIEAVNEFIASFPAEGGAIPTVQITPKTDVALAGYSVIAKEGVEPSFVSEFTAAITNKCGDILDGTSGKSITICAPDTENFYSDSYKISLNDGNIVVEGGSQEMLEMALELLLTTLTDTGFRMNTVGYEKEHAYEQANLAINNELIKDYEIVADTKVFGAKIAAEYLQDEIKSKTGKKLAIVSESDGPAFVIDIKTNDEGKYFIDAEGSTITLSGAGANGAYTAAKALVKKIGNKTSLSVADSSGAMFTLNNTAYKLKNGQELKWAMWGDSVGEGNNCGLSTSVHQTLTQCDCYPTASFLADWLARDYPEATINMINPSLGGRHTAWGVYHIDEEIIDKGNVDLVMISLGTNDSPYAIKYEQSLLNYQSMIEKIRRANPNADIVFLMYGRNYEVKSMMTGGDVQFMRAMFEISDYYNIPIVDTVHKIEELTEVSKDSSSDLSNLTNEKWNAIIKDTVHPNNEGYELYAEIYYQSIKAAIDAAAGTQLITPVMPEPMNENSKIDTERYYAHLGENPSAAELIGLTYEGGWQQNGWTYTANSTASFSFTGTGIELYLSNHGTPIYEVVITDKNGEVVFSETKTYNSWWYDPQMNLPYGDYDVVITAMNGQDLDGTANDVALRITYINVKGAKKVSKDVTFLETNLSDTLSDFSAQYDGSLKSVDTVYKRFELAKAELPEEVTVLDEVSIKDYPEVLKKQVFVSATRGNDAYAGTVGRPFATLQAALAAMEGQGGGIIWVEGGSYYSEDPIAVGPEHSGTEESPLFIIGYGDKPAVVFGGNKLSSESFSKVNTATDTVASRIKSTAQGSVYSIDLAALGWTADDVVLGGGKLVINGEGYHVARFPNLYTDNGEIIDNDDLLYVDTVEKVGSVNTEGSTLPYNPGTEGFKITVGGKDTASYYSELAEIGAWENTGNVFLSGSVYTHWHSGKYQIADFYDDGSLHIESSAPCDYGAAASKNNNFYLYNAIEALDAPGEFFIDVDTMTLYVYPMESLEGASVVYAGAQLVDSEGKTQKNYGAITVNGTGNNQKISEPVQYVVIDGIDVASSTWAGYYVSYSENIIIQNAVVRNTNYTGVRFERCYNSALTHSEIYRGVGVAYYDESNMSYTGSLKPSNIFIQNNKFYEPAVGSQYAVEIRDAIRSIISHNDFEYCCVLLGGMENVVEYNEFRGGSRDVTDGGMVYTVSYGKMGHHVRYNVFHMFDASKRAIYNDGKSGGNYAYGNLMNMRGSTVAEGLNPWYSSSGHGNVCFENVMVLRDYEDEYLPLEPKTKNGYGDSVLESKLFYYYKDEAKGTDQAAAWLMSGENRGQKEIDLLLGGTKASYNKEAIKARFPDHAAYLEAVRLILAAYYGDLGATYEKPVYDVEEAKGVTYTYIAPTDLKIYVPFHQYKADGDTVDVQAKTVEANEGDVLTFTYEELSAIERLWRQGAMLVIKDNVIIGGGYIDGGYGGYTTRDTAERKTITISTDIEKGYIEGTSIVANNYIEQGVSVMPGIADGGYELSDYEISDDAWNVIAESVSSVEGLKKQNYKRAGRTLAEFAD